jgi:hypothetical protein
LYAGLANFGSGNLANPDLKELPFFDMRFQIATSSLSPGLKWNSSLKVIVPVSIGALSEERLLFVKTTSSICGLLNDYVEIFFLR